MISAPEDLQDAYVFHRLALLAAKQSVALEHPHEIEQTIDAIAIILLGAADHAPTPQLFLTLPKITMTLKNSSRQVYIASSSLHPFITKHIR